MNLQEIINEHNLDTFAKLHECLTKEPYKMIVKGDDTRAIILKNKNIPLTDFMKEVDGSIIDVINKKIICYTPYYHRVEIKPEQQFQSSMNWDNVIVEELIDGSVVRLYYDGEWKVATLTTTNADKAYWYSDKSFKELFLECAEGFLKLETLHKEYVYGFIIRHPENKIVTHYSMKDIVHIFTMDGFKKIDVNLNIIKPKKLVFNDFKQMIESCKKLPFFIPGYMVSYENSNIKYIAPHYTYVKELKGNFQKMDVRYLQIRNNATANEFLLYFPEYLPIVQEIESKIVKRVNEILQLYIDVKIRKEWKDLDKLEKYIIYNVHAIYLKSGIPINFQTIYNYFNQLPYYKIAQALNITLYK